MPDVPQLYRLTLEEEVDGNDEYEWLAFDSGEDAHIDRVVAADSNQSLLAGWVPMALRRVRGRKQADIQFLAHGVWVLNSRAAEVLTPLVKGIAEFLPVDVVGDCDNPSDEQVTRLPDGSQPRLLILRPLRFVELGQSAQFTDYPLLDVATGKESIDRVISRFVFDPVELEDNHVFRIRHSDRVYVSGAFRRACDSAGLSGVVFESLTYTAAGDRDDQAVADPAALDRIPETPTAFELAKAGEMPTVSEELWKSWVDHWQWICAVMEIRGRCATPLTMAKPLTENQLALLCRRIKLDLPTDFMSVLRDYAARVEFDWFVDDDETERLPDELHEASYGGGVLWDADRLPEFAAAAAKHAESPWLAFRDGLRNRLPFIDVGDGDLIAFDMRAGRMKCPVVYLSHENDPDLHERILGESFTDFMTRWTLFGCPGPDLHCMEAFYDHRKMQLNDKGHNATRWRKWLETGE